MPTRGEVVKLNASKTTPQGYKTLFKLSSAETKIYPAHKCYNANNCFAGFGVLNLQFQYIWTVLAFMSSLNFMLSIKNTYNLGTRGPRTCLFMKPAYQHMPTMVHSFRVELGLCMTDNWKTNFLATMHKSDCSSHSYN